MLQPPGRTGATDGERGTQAGRAATGAYGCTGSGSMGRCMRFCLAAWGPG